MLPNSFAAELRHCRFTDEWITMTEEVEEDDAERPWLQACEQWTPTFTDMLTDHVRMRIIVPVIMLLLYYLLATIYTGRWPSLHFFAWYLAAVGLILGQAGEWAAGAHCCVE